MKIIVPERIQTISVLIDRPGELRKLRLILGHDNRGPAPCGFSDASADRGQNVFLGSIEDLLSGVQAQPIQVELFDPIGGVGQEKFAYGTGVWTIKVNGLPPVIFVSVGKVVTCEFLKIVAVRTEMVVNHIQNDGQARVMSAVHKRAEIVRLAVKPYRCKQPYAIVAPPEASRKIGDGHDLEDRDAG